MEVYEFDKCLLDRLEESMSVLSWKDQVISASQVRAEWSYFIELQIEPTGWQGLWKIPRVICEELRLRFPTVVFGIIEQVLFKQLKAVFLVQAVQDGSVHLPERHEVALEDLWPTYTQENTELNVERTADCLDRLRFFYNYVWMPWDNDNDDDLNWVEKHLETRIRFCYDLRKRSIKRSLATHIRTLLIEAKYIQQRREYLELGLSDDEELEHSLDKSQITDLMRLHLRLAMIRSEIEMIENPEMRRIYEDVHFDDEKHLKNADNRFPIPNQKAVPEQAAVCFLVTLPCTLSEQLALLRVAEKLIPQNSLVQICPSLQNALDVCHPSDRIFLSPGTHTIKFLEYLNDSGNITGLIGNESQTEDIVHKVVIMSPDDDSILLVFDGDFQLENLVLDCKNIRTGILLKNGKVRLKNCRILGDGKSSTQQGIVCSGAATDLILDNCLIDNFATGIVLHKGSRLALVETKIFHCEVGLDLSAHNTKIHFNGARIHRASKCGVYLDSVPLENTAATCLTLKKLCDLENYTYLKNLCPWSGECDFKDCKANIYIRNKTKSLFAEKTLKYILANDEIAHAQEAVAVSTASAEHNNYMST